MKSEFEVENKNLEEVVDEILLLMPEMADEKYNENGKNERKTPI